MIEELRQRVPDLQWYPEKYIVVFLCARRHNLDDAEVLVKKFLDKKTELGYRWKAPEVTTDPDVQILSQEGAGARWPGAHDKYGRMINYFFMKNNQAKRDPETRFAALSKWSFFEIEWLIFTEPLYNLRQGLIWVMDCKDFSITKNIDMSPQFRKWSDDVQGILPNRVRGIYIFNAGIFMKALVKLAKLVLPSKLSKRMHMIEEKNLNDFITKKEHLPTLYGGDISVSYEVGIKVVREGEEILKAHYKKVRHDRRALKKKLREEIAAAAAAPGDTLAEESE